MKKAERERKHELFDANWHNRHIRALGSHSDGSFERCGADRDAALGIVH